MRLYPDLYSRRFAWMLADLLMVAWIYLCVQAGLWVNNLVLQLDALAQGVISAGKTFDSWILSFNQGIQLSNVLPALIDRKSTRLNSSHDQISYAVFCLNKQTK